MSASHNPADGEMGERQIHGEGTKRQAQGTRVDDREPGGRRPHSGAVGVPDQHETGGGAVLGSNQGGAGWGLLPGPKDAQRT